MSIKNYIIKSIKYGPIILALSCSIKIFIFSYINISTYLMLIASTINVFLNIMMLWFISCLNIYFGYCRAVKKLCKYTKYGYWYFIVALYTGFIDSNYSRLIAVLYLIFIITYCIKLYARTKIDCQFYSTRQSN